MQRKEQREAARIYVFPNLHPIHTNTKGEP